MTESKESNKKQSKPDPWDELLRIGKEISENRETDRHSTDILSDMRR